MSHLSAKTAAAWRRLFLAMLGPFSLHERQPHDRSLLGDAARLLDTPASAVGIVTIQTDQWRLHLLKAESPELNAAVRTIPGHQWNAAIECDGWTFSNAAEADAIIEALRAYFTKLVIVRDTGARVIEGSAEIDPILAGPIEIPTSDWDIDTHELPYDAPRDYIHVASDPAASRAADPDLSTVAKSLKAVGDQIAALGCILAMDRTTAAAFNPTRPNPAPLTPPAAKLDPDATYEIVQGAPQWPLEVKPPQPEPAPAPLRALPVARERCISIELVSADAARRLTLDKADRTDIYGGPEPDAHVADETIRGMFARFSEEYGMPERERLLVKPDPSAIAAVRGLAAQAPHMAALVHTFADALALYHKADKPLRIAPTVIVGPPGIGKTWLVRKICTEIGIPFLARPMSITTAAFAWSGLHRSWRASTPGIVATQLIEHPVANPLIFVDEFDKVNMTKSETSAYNAFYNLLERCDAAEFVDEFLMAPIDASHISWIFTANNLGEIPSAILDRLNVVTLTAPSAEHRRRIIAAIYAERNATFGGLFDAEPSDQLVTALSAGSLRTVGRTLEAAMARAAACDRSGILPADLKAGGRGSFPTIVSV